MIWALVLGTVLAVSALAFVLYPIFFGVSRPASASASASPRLNPGESAVAALREIEFDRATGKLSDSDYNDLKSRYTREAIASMRREEAAGGEALVGDEEIEAAVRAYRDTHATCPVHGARPEPGAVYCSECGRFLRDRCSGCGAPVTEADARFCAACGNQLAA